MGRRLLTLGLLGFAGGALAAQTVPPDDTPTPPDYIPPLPPPREIEWVLVAGMRVRMDFESENGPYIVASIKPEAGSVGHFQYSNNLFRWTPATLPQLRDGSEITTRLRALNPPLYIRYVETVPTTAEPN